MNGKKMTTVSLMVVMLSTVIVLSASGATAWDNFQVVTTYGTYGDINLHPTDIAVDASGNVYAVDGDHSYVAKFTTTGEFITKWGSYGAGDGQFANPSKIAVDKSSNVYVVDSGNNRVQKFSADGAFLDQWTSEDYGGEHLSYPSDIAVDSSGNMYVVASSDDLVEKFDSGGVFLTEWMSHSAGEGYWYGIGGIALDPSGNVFLLDTYNERVEKFTSDGVYLTSWGEKETGEEWSYPTDIAVGPAGNVFVSEGGDLYKFDNDGGFIVKLPISEQGLYGSQGLAIGSMGYIYVAEYYGHIWKFDKAGKFVAKWGYQTSDDGQYSGANGVAVDASDNVYVADTSNHRVQKYSPSGFLVAMWGSDGSGDGQFSYPNAIAVDRSGNVYVADSGNNRVQKFTGDGEFVAKWGSEGSGKGQFSYPVAIAVDRSGQVFVSDNGNGRVEKFSNDGTFLAQWGAQGIGEPSEPWEFTPQGIAADDDGNIFVADTWNSSVRKFTGDGVLVDTWTGADSGDAAFYEPRAVAVDASGNVYLTTGYRDSVLKFTNDGEFINTWYGGDEYWYESYGAIGIAVDSSGFAYLAYGGPIEKVELTTADTIPPTITAASPGLTTLISTKETSVVRTYQASYEDNKEVTSAKVTLDGVDVSAEWEVNTSGFAHDATLGIGEHAIVLTVRDAAGNQVQHTWKVNVVQEKNDPVETTVWPTGDGVARGTKICVQFSEPMDRGTVKIVVDGVKGTTSWKDDTAIFTPSSLLEFGKTYSATVTGTSADGDEVSKTWSFTTVTKSCGLSGTIKDANGNPIVNAVITLSDGRTGVSDAAGHFTLTGVSTGSLTMTVTRDGYETMSKSISTVDGQTVDMGTVSVEPSKSDDSSDDRSYGPPYLALGAAAMAAIAGGVVVAVLHLRRR